MRRYALLALLLCCGGGVAQDVPAVDLLSMPAALRKRNISSKGAGCCTFRSAEYAAHWQHEPALFGLPEWMKNKGIAGGGTPDKQARMVEMIAKDRGLPAPKFAQYEGRDPSVIELCLKTGRAPGVTWNGNHMLTCVHLDDARGAIVDNNAPDRVQWFSRSEFLRRWTAGGGGWVFVLLAPAPTPPPSGGVQEDPPPGGVTLDYRWQEAGMKGHYFLFRNGKQAGYYDGEKYLPLLSPGQFGAACEPPVELPGEQIGGLEWRPSGIERAELNGRTVAKRRVIEALSGFDGHEDGPPDDSDKPWLTIIGQKADRDRVINDLETHPALREIAAGHRVQCYAPDYWAVQGFGFRTDGRPTIYVQDAAGRVLHRQDDYDGAEQLAGALRRPGPYDPATDPDRRKKPEPKPDAKPAEPLPPVEQWPWQTGTIGALAGALGALLASRKKGA
jgi:hypothetical protein